MKNSTIFCDIDGTIFKYRPFESYGHSCPIPIHNMIYKLQELTDKGHVIVLTTARPEDYRDLTKEELKMYNVPYDQLVMGIGRSTRYLINDMEDPEKPRAISINVIRDKGLSTKDTEILSLPKVF